VIRHFAAVAAVGLPTLYYHYPQTTGLRLTPAEVGVLFREVDLCGIKNSSLDTADTLAQIAAVGRPIRMFTGHSFDFLACLRGGAAGSVCPVALLLPRSAVEVARAHAAGDAARADAAQQRFFRALPFVMPEPSAAGPIGVPHAGVKEALAALGLIRCAEVRAPQPPLSAQRREQIHREARAVVEIGG
jgi:dihydrodipicolinate synthase/N-acetylneuraminate lyase